MRYSKTFKTIFATLAITLSGAALGSPYHVFGDAAGGPALSRGDLDAAEKHFSGKLDFADLNNYCVYLALEGRVDEAAGKCISAIDLVSSQRMSVRRRALPKIEANLNTLKQVPSALISSSDD
jgi:hypothetical protein